MSQYFLLTPSVNTLATSRCATTATCESLVPCPFFPRLTARATQTAQQHVSMRVCVCVLLTLPDGLIVKGLGYRLNARAGQAKHS